MAAEVKMQGPMETIGAKKRPASGYLKQLSKGKKGKIEPEETRVIDLERIEVKSEIGLNSIVSRLRRGAKATIISYKEKKINGRRDGDEYVKVKDENVADSEAAALAGTVCHQGLDSDGNPSRRLFNFVVFDNYNQTVALESWKEGSPSMHLEGLVLPNTVASGKEQGLRCTELGPVIDWHIDGYEKGASPASIRVSTESADYTISKPAAKYRKVFEKTQEKANLCVEVFRALSKPDGGNPDLSYSELVAKVSQAMRGREKPGAKSYFANGPLLQHGTFVAQQLSNLDKTATESDQLFADLDAIRALAAASAEHLHFKEQEAAAVRQPPKALTIGQPIVKASRQSLSSDGLASPITTDEEYARKLALQGQLPTRHVVHTVRALPKTYVKISESEIADDYPQPTYFVKSQDECNELDIFEGEDEVDFVYREEKKLEDWTLYNGELRLISLEMLPMLAGVDEDITIFGSGIVSTDDGGYHISEQKSSGSNSSPLVSDNGSEKEGKTVPEVAGGSNSSPPNDAGGLRIYLSAIREWKVEFGANMLFVWIKTDMFWYRLGKPSSQFKAFYGPVLQIAELAVHVIAMLKAESRVSRLSFLDIVNRVANERKKDKNKTPTKQDVAKMERYMVVHGQIILQQLREYPDPTIQKSAFASGLEMKMLERQHIKLKVTKKVLKRAAIRNNNPSANLRPDATKRKPMPATTTRLIKGIWSSFYEKMASFAVEEGSNEGEVDEEGENGVEETEEQDSDEDGDTLMTERTDRGIGEPRVVLKKCKNADMVHKFIGKPIGKMPDGRALFGKAIVNGGEIGLLSGVLADIETSDESYSVMLLVEYMWKEGDGTSMIHGRILEKGCETLLGNVADEREIFLTEKCEDVSLDVIRCPIVLERKESQWGHEYRKKQFQIYQEDKIRAKDRQEKGLPMEYFYQRLYVPDKGGFFDLPKELGLGCGVCNACKLEETKRKTKEIELLPDSGGFRKEDIEYMINDFLYLESEAFTKAKDNESVSEKFKGSRNVGLKPWAIGQLLKVESKNGKGSWKTGSKQITVRRFFRPEEISQDLAYKSDLREVYYSQKTVTLTMNEVVGKCKVFRQDAGRGDVLEGGDDTFFCCSSFDPKTDKLTSAVPKEVDFSKRMTSEESLKKNKGKEKISEEEQLAALSAARKGKGKVVHSEVTKEIKCDKDERKLATLDIFAGCGGLSEGLQQSGVSHTKWAIEYEHPAAQAFALNHPDAEVFCDNCNVILRCIMEKGGDPEDCESTEEAAKQASDLSEEKKRKLPMPGQVDFINGGPPCQGFSGMNRFNNSAWSKVQCEMILAFLSYADYFRPRYFLLENVRNFVSFNKGQTFRLTLSSLLAMGYQVRFGVLQAGNYGVAQSRKRAFIWAAAPGEVLPDWPTPQHVFASSQISINLTERQVYSAVPDAGKGAPLRSVTVRDSIGDLPQVGNGANKEEIEYVDVAQSWFQKQIRGAESVLRDHISKEMNELNLERCKRVPKETPGADWRTLPEIMIKLSDGRQVALIPWCLPNTAERHNQWKGLFGRLDWSGNFPTSVTDPQPMGKVGMCFHPCQDRIITVRECARSQGFPDSFRFFGSIQAKHRQIGNAVPPPLARALGKMLKAALLSKEAE